jgi:hypothetical protein
MIIQTFTVVLLRLLAIQVALSAVSLLANFVIELKTGHPESYLLAAAALCFVAAFGVWMLSPLIGRIVCAKLPPSAAPINATLVDLYSFAFVFVGLYLVTTSAGPSLGWIYYIFSHASADRNVNYYKSFNAALQLIIGVALIFKGRAISIRLAKEHTAEQDTAANS